MAGEVAFFELGVDDTGRARAFYEALFGWATVPGPHGAGLEIRGAGVPGGMHAGDAGGGPYLFFRVDDLDCALVRVRELGGTVLDMDVEGDAEARRRYGRFVLCRDDQGSHFGLHQRPEH